MKKKNGTVMELWRAFSSFHIDDGVCIVCCVVLTTAAAAAAFPRELRCSGMM